MDTRFDAVETKMEARFNAVETDMDKRFHAVELRLTLGRSVFLKPSM